MIDWFGWLVDGDLGSQVGGPETLLLVLLLSFIIGQFIAWIYMWTHQGLSYSQSFVASLVVIPMIVALMMVLMSGSLMVAFGLLAIFAVVRFRNVLKDTRDTTFILWAMMQGLAVGTLRHSIAVVGAAGVAVVLVYLRVTSFGSRHQYDAVLTLRMTGDLAGGLIALKEILHRYAFRAHLAGQRQLSDAGLDLSYRLLLRDPQRRDELRMMLERQGQLEEVALFLREDESEV